MMDDFENLVFPPELPKDTHLGVQTSEARKGQQPLDEKTLKSLSDLDGRIVDENGLKRAIFRGKF